MQIVELLKNRGLLQDCSDPAGVNKLGSADSFYVGVDPTAPSLQVGNLIPLLVSIHLARAGLKPVILFGGATGSIGDPSGKTQERKLLSLEEIEANVASQSKKALEIFERVGIKPDFVNNFDWTKDFSVITFLRDVGKHFTVNYMLQKEVIKARVDGEGMSFTEFSYMLIQANDFYHLYKTRGCKLQIGGSDQWGNITAGLELIRRKGAGEAYALSWPLLTDRSGKKFGKSEGGAVWLDGGLTSPYKLYQFFRNIEDADVLHYLKVFTFLTDAELSEIENEITTAPEKRAAQVRLADEVCTLIHGKDATKFATRCAEVLFGGSVDGLTEAQLDEVFSEAPRLSIERSRASQLQFVDLLTEAGAAKSKGEARKLITNGGAYINNERITDPTLTVSSSPAANANNFVIRTGKKNYWVVKVVD